MSDSERSLSFSVVIRGGLENTKHKAEEADRILFRQVENRTNIICYVPNKDGETVAVDRNPFDAIQNDDMGDLSDLFQDMQIASEITIYTNDKYLIESKNLPFSDKMPAKGVSKR